MQNNKQTFYTEKKNKSKKLASGLVQHLPLPTKGVRPFNLLRRVEGFYRLFAQDGSLKTPSQLVEQGGRFVPSFGGI